MGMLPDLTCTRTFYFSNIGLDPGHTCFLGNEHADTLAKKGTWTPFLGHKPASSVGWSIVNIPHMMEIHSRPTISEEACEGAISHSLQVSSQTSKNQC